MIKKADILRKIKIFYNQNYHYIPKDLDKTTKLDLLELADLLGLLGEFDDVIDFRGIKGGTK